MAITETNIVNQSLIALGARLITDLDTDTSKRATVMRELYEIKRNYLLRKFHWKFAVKRAQLTPIEYKLNFDTMVTAPVVGEIVSGATGVGTIDHILMTSDTAGTLWLKTVTIGYVDDENITGDIAFDADANGVEYSPAPINEFDYIYALPTDFIQLMELYPNYLTYNVESNFILSGESSVLEIQYTYRVTDPNEMDATFVEALASLLAREAAIPLTDSYRKQTKMDEMYEDKLSDARYAGSIEDDLEVISAEDWLVDRI